MPESVSRPGNSKSLETKGTILGTAAAAVTLGVTFGVSSLMHGWTRNTLSVQSPIRASQPAGAGEGELAAHLVRGRVLFSQECAACHGSRGQGGFGPGLRRLEISEAQVAATITNGIKPEMPGLGHKYGRTDVRALTLFVGSLNKPVTQK